MDTGYIEQPTTNQYRRTSWKARAVLADWVYEHFSRLNLVAANPNYTKHYESREKVFNER